MPRKKPPRRPVLRWDQRTIPQSVNGGWMNYLLTRKPNEETVWWPRAAVKVEKAGEKKQRARRVRGAGQKR
jgi:hypothetical protein